MSKRPHGQLRRGQIITTYGPGALIDLPRHSGIVSGLDNYGWPSIDCLDEIVEPRLSRKLLGITGNVAPRLYAPPRDETDPREPKRGIRVWRFPEWFVVRENDDGKRRRSRRLVHRRALDAKNRFEGLAVVATRFVRACPRGHVDDLDWHGFAHAGTSECARTRQIWLDEWGTSGDLADLSVRCECGKTRSLSEATLLELNPLGKCRGARPWLGRSTNEDCNQPSRLLIRTAANAYFPQVMSVLSLPNRGSAVQTVVSELWDDLQLVKDVAGLTFLKGKPKITEMLAPFSDAEVIAAIHERRDGRGEDEPVKEVELAALLGVPEGFGDDVPIDPDFHARRLPPHIWRRPGRSEGIANVIQVHRLREVVALIGFTRFEAATPDINGEFDSDVARASLAQEATWLPAVENRGEGVFIQLDAQAIAAWLTRPEVVNRLDLLQSGYARWAESRKSNQPFRGGPYVLLHTLSHMLIQSLSMRCGYPASSIRERIYTDSEAGGFGILLYTGSPDAEGTLGGLVQEARHVEDHLAQALRSAALCSNDPICAQHAPGQSLEERWLHGAACHGCALVAETSCEARNDYLDRALVVQVLGVRGAAFFGARG